MGFQVVQLQYETMKEEAFINGGVLLERPYYQKDLGFAKIISYYTPHDIDLWITSIHEYNVKDMGDGFKEVYFNVPELAKVEKQEAILVIVRHAHLVQGSPEIEKIAGRYPGDGIWLLRPNQKISVIRGDKTEEFAALQFENKMYLVKVNEN